MVARQRRHDQDGGLLEIGECLVAQILLEVKQATERLVHVDELEHADVLAGDLDRLDAEFRFFIILAEAVHEFVTGGNALRERCMSQGRDRIGEQLCRRLGPLDKRVEERAVQLVDLVKHECPLSGLSGIAKFCR